jgi:hypothetical protein
MTPPFLRSNFLGKNSWRSFWQVLACVMTRWTYPPHCWLGAAEIEITMLDVGPNQFHAEFVADVEALGTLRQ